MTFPLGPITDAWLVDHVPTATTLEFRDVLDLLAKNDESPYRALELRYPAEFHPPKLHETLKLWVSGADTTPTLGFDLRSVVEEHPTYRVDDLVVEVTRSMGVYVLKGVDPYSGMMEAPEPILNTHQLRATLRRWPELDADAFAVAELLRSFQFDERPQAPVPDWSSGSPFFEIPPSEHLAANRSAFAIYDAFPVTKGHALVISRRLIADWWEATPDERTDLFSLVDQVKSILDRSHRPEGYNVGFNAGATAGQTVPHLHVHVIPRYSGDVPDPRGGIRHVIPDRGNYLVPQHSSAKPSASLLQLFSGENRELEQELVHRLRDGAFDAVDVVVSFVMRSGLQLLDEALQDAIERGAAVRILTTDYLGLTEREALARLLDMAGDSFGMLQVRIFHDPATSFHPKAYLFSSRKTGDALAVVGSSNLSRSGLAGGVEWNVSVDDAEPMLQRFDELWDDPRSIDLTDEWLRTYRPTRDKTVPITVEIDEAPVQPVTPRPIQQEALRRLEETRAEGFEAGLVVLATGLGKTWLAAFDTARPQFQRVLFVAHREEILRQSRDVFRQVQPDGELGLYYGKEKQANARIVFASVQTLSGHLQSFDPDEFDYIVVDEFHHAAAASYRKVIDYFRPQFLLGLTATPDRMDGADLLALCADNLVYDCGLLEGIDRKELVPFHYWGVPDPVDFEPIPWRGGRFETKQLVEAVETHERAERAYEEWLARRGERTLAFCVTTSHADFMAEYFSRLGVRCASVHSGATTAPRHESIDALRAGELQVVFAVDLFNEGLDVPEIDTVLMLRPTESPIVFLQQLGRGLRTLPGKERLHVVDFIGNHRSFLSKPRTLLSLGARQVPSNAKLIAALESGDFGLPPGCAVEYDLEVVDMLRELGKTSGRAGLAEYCRSYAEEEGARPSATQAHHAGFNLASVRSAHGSWLGLLDDLGLLSEMERAVLGHAGDVLDQFEKAQVNKSYKLVTLRALLHDGALRTGASVSQVAATSRQLILRDPRLLRDLANKEFPDLGSAPVERWEQYWREWPIAAWTGALSGATGTGLFSVDALDRFVPRYSVPDDVGDAFDAMAAEIVEYRLAKYLVGAGAVSGGASVLRLGHADGRPLVWLDRSRNPGLPSGEAVFRAEGREYVGSFVKIALNVATLPGQDGNALHALLRGWFGPSAGHPGTNHQITLQELDGVHVMRPVAAESEGGGDVVPLFPSYAVACGALRPEGPRPHEGVPLNLKLAGGTPADASRQFVCFARGDSMNGGPDPVRHGDPLLLEWIESGSARDYVGERVLIEYRDPRTKQTAAVLKVLERDGSGFRLASTNPAVPDIEGSAEMRPVARLLRRLDQAEINPLTDKLGEAYKRQDIPPLYGLEYNSGNWQSGHVSLASDAVLFVTLNKSSSMSFGADYVDHFEGRDEFVWSSQSSTGPDGKKGREILEALETGKAIHLWARRRKADVAFFYAGRVVPVHHEGSKPTSVRFRLLTPVDSETWSSLHR